MPENTCIKAYRGAEKSLARKGKTKVEKSPHLNWVTQCLTVAYDGACSPNVSAEWREFPTTPSIPSYDIGK
jgi:hypothetical protein